MDLFSVVHLEMPRAVAIGVRPLGEGETPLLEATDGRVVDLHIPEAEGSPQVINVPPVQMVAPPPPPQEPAAAQPPPPPTVIPVVNVEESEEESEEPLLSRKRAGDGDDGGSSKRPRVEAGASSALVPQTRY